MNQTDPTLTEQLLGDRYQQRYEQIAIISRHEDLAERSAAARTLLSEIGLMRVFDRFTNGDHAALLDHLEPLAYPPEQPEAPRVYGIGAYSILPPK